LEQVQLEQVQLAQVQFGAGAVGVRGLDSVFLCFGVSGSTKGPF
jgi:hypothetical protein